MSSNSCITPSQVAKHAREIYSHSPFEIRLKQTLRPYICPFHVLIELVPSGATLLDVGCGAGLFILTLARLRNIRSAVGFDSDLSAIKAAQYLAAGSHNLKFKHRDAGGPWPDGHFNVVSMIDVMHHVPPEQQAQLIKRAAEHICSGGIFLYKDIASTPHWRAWANRFHDLLFAKQWIHYAIIDDVIAWAAQNRLNLHAQGSIDMLWYRHEWCVFRRAQEVR